jgi:precorrin-3B methylase
MNNEQIKQAADMLYQAEKSRIPVELISVKHRRQRRTTLIIFSLNMLSEDFQMTKRKIIGRK